MTTAATAKRRGSKFEKVVRDYLIGEGFNASLTDLAGANDIGDIQGVPYTTIQCKATSNETLGVSMTDAEKQAHRAGNPWYVVVRWRRSKGVAEAYVTMPMWQYVDMLGRIVGEDPS